MRASGASVGVVGERSEQREGTGERSERRGGVGRAKRAGGGCCERSERRGGAAGRPRIVAEGDVLRVFS